MIRFAFLFLSALLALASPAQADNRWSTAQAENLLTWAQRVSDEGLKLPSAQARELRLAIDAGDLEALAPVADRSAITLMRAWSGRCCGPARPSWWHISGVASDAELRKGLADALKADQLDLYLRSVRPVHPHYASLVSALADETDPVRHAIIETNLARWRWMPRTLGKRHLLVNIASQQLTLWDEGRPVGRWRVIVGKPATKTPVFSAQVSGAVLNPWWEIPSSIAAEGIGSFVRRNPSAARARGYVYQNGRYRQMPGDNNALGRMKLLMPNPYSVFLHETSKRELFDEERRFLSHGCVRVDNALSFVATLFFRDGWDQERVDAVVGTGKTQTISLAESVPLYVTYFTVEPSLGRQGVQFLEDVYRRDPARLSVSQTTAAGVQFAQSGFGEPGDASANAVDPSCRAN
ncbi:hypothetical protein EH31_01475 [Erythrobacter longus]|uniref:L,D-TPase catalytic domain-containing protein n=1 Tax=Erythrobacter longus TaxID=1044 RepID=A0A074MF10_ERYLO|nr:L,D-transpeptidase family protein [Erythrobacter longus]KEO91360.1 hypothetical protein EH31_01475 [Erythrobacter longus]